MLNVNRRVVNHNLFQSISLPDRIHIIPLLIYLINIEKILDCNMY